MKNNWRDIDPAENKGKGKTMKSKYIFLDIDGTLVGYDSKIPESAMKALSLAKANGHKIIIASGRAYCMIYPELLRAVDFDGVISSGGACVMVDGKVIYESYIEDENLKFVIDYFRANGITYLLMSKDDIYAEPVFNEYVLPGMIKAGYNKALVEQAYGTNIEVKDIRDVKGGNKLAYFTSPFKPEKIASDLDGRFYVVDFSVGKTEEANFFGEMNNGGVNKASGIDEYLKYVGGSIEDTIAIGDSANDLEMLEHAAVAVAMGNGTDAAKSAADFVTTDVDKDGIYNAFLKLGLI